jgi:hypothetical protein
LRGPEAHLRCAGRPPCERQRLTTYVDDSGNPGGIGRRVRGRDPDIEDLLATGGSWDGSTAEYPCALRAGCGACHRVVARHDGCVGDALISRKAGAAWDRGAVEGRLGYVASRDRVVCDLESRDRLVGDRRVGVGAGQIAASDRVDAQEFKRLEAVEPVRVGGLGVDPEKAARVDAVKRVGIGRLRARRQEARVAWALS